MYDVIVIGARCAGSPVSMLLARKGYRVLLVDRAAFPSDHLSTHFIHQPGGARLRRWGLLDQVKATNCPPIRQIRFDVGTFALSGAMLPYDGVAEAWAPRRTVLDKILVDAAAQAGVEVRERFSVEQILIEDGCVKGIQGRTGTERARIVIGADGLHSPLARAAGAPKTHERPTMSCGYYTYWSGVPVEGAELYPRVGCGVIAFPTNDGLTLVVTARALRDFDAFRADTEGTYLKTLEEASPEFAARVRAGRREERFYGTADMANFFRKPFGPGWALVGDAGYHKDPYTAQGITDAFRDAELLAEAVDDGFSGRRPLEQALAGYEQRRNEAAMPMFEFTVQLARLEAPPPEVVALHAALRTNPAETERFLGLISGVVPIPEFFAPENIMRILSGSARRAAAEN